MRRMKMKASQSQRQFTRNATSHPKNFRGAPMRGGIRL